MSLQLHLYLCNEVGGLFEGRYHHDLRLCHVSNGYG